LETLEGPLHSVTVAHARRIKPAEIRAIDGVPKDISALALLQMAYRVATVASSNGSVTT
jgi:hypothetical protein